MSNHDVVTAHELRDVRQRIAELEAERDDLRVRYDVAVANYARMLADNARKATEE